MDNRKNKLPKYFLNEYLPKSSGISFLGISIDELSRDDLLAALCFAAENNRPGLEDDNRTINFALDLVRAG